MVMTTCRPAAASAGVGAREAPAATRASARSAVRLKTRTSWPASSSRRPIGSPIAPVPRIATRIVMTVIFDHQVRSSPRPLDREWPGRPGTAREADCLLAAEARERVDSTLAWLSPSRGIGRRGQPVSYPIRLLRPARNRPSGRCAAVGAAAQRRPTATATASGEGGGRRGRRQNVTRAPPEAPCVTSGRHSRLNVTSAARTLTRVTLSRSSPPSPASPPSPGAAQSGRLADWLTLTRRRPPEVAAVGCGRTSHALPRRRRV
jgi:hypothetical protein